MLRISYVSRASADFGAEDLSALQEAVQLRNARSQITGLLLFSGGHFLQALEGAADMVEETFARIERDPRHVVLDEPRRQRIAQRSFPHWSSSWVDAGRLLPEQAIQLERMRTLICRNTRDPYMRALMAGFLGGYRDLAS